MINSDICVNCICLPVCRNKTKYKLTLECDLLINAFFDLCRDLKNSESITKIRFDSLNITFNISRHKYNNDLVINFFDDHDIVSFRLQRARNHNYGEK